MPPNGGGYDVYRSLYYDGATLSYTKVNSVLLTSPTFTDNPIIPSGIPVGKDVYWRYNVKAKDSQLKYSVPSEDYWLFVGKTVSGAISSATTWDANRIVVGSVTVNSGVTLTIQSGTNDRIFANCGIYINGKIKADGVTFQGNGSGRWYGITINGSYSEACDSYIKNSTIKDCDIAITIANSSNIEINKCDLHGYDIGVLLRGSCHTWVYNCHIRGDHFADVQATENSIGEIGHCEFHGNTSRPFTYYSTGSATTGLGYGWENVAGKNNLQYNGNNCTIVVDGGRPMLDEGYNNIYRLAEGHCGNNTSNTIYARWNYWDGGYTGWGPISYQPYLSSPVFGAGPNWSLSKGSQDEFKQIWQAYFDRKFELSKSLSLAVFQEKKQKDRLAEALFIAMKSAYHLNELEAEKEFLQTIHLDKDIDQNVRWESLRWLSKLAITDEKYDDAINLVLSIPDSSYCKELLLDLGIEILSRKKNMEKGERVFDILTDRYTDKRTKMVKDWTLSYYQKQLNREQEEELNYREKPDSSNNKVTVVPNQTQLFDAYPNPFNPSTAISYQLTVNSNVRLSIFDMLGREVAVLADGMKEAGRYSATFDASKLSSGVYFSRLTVNPQEGMSIVLTRKLLLMK